MSRGFSSAAVIRAADRALKTTSVELVELRLGDGLGGFSCSAISPDTERALDVAVGDVDGPFAAPLALGHQRLELPEHIVARAFDDGQLQHLAGLLAEGEDLLDRLA